MILAKTQTLSSFDLDRDIARETLSHEFKNVSEDLHAELMQIFARYAFPHRPEQRRVTRIGFLAAPKSGKTESCEWMHQAFPDIERLTTIHFLKGQGEFHHPDIGFIRQYDAAATDHDTTLPQYDDYEYWDDPEKFGVDLVEHADMDFADKNFHHIMTIQKPQIGADGVLKRSFILYTAPEVANMPEFQSCIEEMQETLRLAVA